MAGTPGAPGRFSPNTFVSADYNDMIYAATPEEIEARARRWPEPI
jgi:hypothetical protein